MKFLGGIDEGSVVQKLIFAFLGVVLVLGIWTFLTTGVNPVFTSGILPTPWKVLTSFKDLFVDNELIKNTGYSVGLNLAGYLEAILITIPVGFIIGLIK
ncbi:MAG TPA: hypothetical protein VJ508_15645, partial [Saprospiraceae bacterium]|nr:hypothetical protein [Saprospiraceae bacterium]